MRALLRRRIEDRDDGIALVMVLGIMGVIAVLLVATVAYGIGEMRKSSHDADWSAALAAAYAGVEEYESHLANDTGYFVYGNPAAPYSAGSTVQMPPVTSPNPAFGIGAGGTWATVPGSGGKAQFRYEVNNSKFASAGTITLLSTGKVGNQTRSIAANVKQLGFIDFLYFTDYEVGDPVAYDPTDTTNCAFYYSSGNRPSSCGTIYFGGADAINGPLHTNDAIQTNGAAHFNGKVETAYNGSPGPNYVKASGTNTPVFAVNGDPQNTSSIGMPQTNSQLKKETRTDLPGDVPNPGCLYTGPTQITFNSNGTMTVISPWTVRTNTGNDTDTTGSSQAKCGTPGATGLAKITGGKYVGQTMSVASNLVIYVQNVPTATTNVNYTASTTTPPGTGAIKCATNGNAIGYPMASETTPFSSAYGCKTGDAFVSGTLKGNVTVAAENYVYVTGDTKYNSKTDDMLGLVGNNAVWIWNPMQLTDTKSNLSSNSASQYVTLGYNCTQSGSSYTCKKYSPLLTGNDREVDAAILSVGHTFMVQNYNLGTANRGTLTVFGAIAQKYRGPVGTSSGGTMTTGYAKAYTYDDRFHHTAPPKFLSPVTTTYGVTTWVEVQPAFASDGSAAP